MVYNKKMKILNLGLHILRNAIGVMSKQNIEQISLF